MFAADKVTDISKSARNFNPHGQPLIFKLQLKISTQGGHLFSSYCSVQVWVQSGSVNFQLCVNGDGWCVVIPPTKVKAESYLNPHHLLLTTKIESTQFLGSWIH